MRILALPSSFVLVTAFIIGCNRNEEATGLPQQSVAKPKTPQATSKPQTAADPWAATLAETLELIQAPNDERNSAGSLIAVSLNDNDITIADISKLDEASQIKRLSGHSSKLTDTDLSFLPNLSSLEKLELNVNPMITDEGLKHLQGLRELKYLSLFYCPKLTGVGFQYFVDLDQLVLLDIGNNADIADENLRYLQELDNLQILNASPLKGLTDAGLEHLSQIKSLRRLVVSSEGITDGGLEQLSSLTHLEILSLTGCPQLTEAGIEKLRRQLPDCKVVWQ